jgi:hypothetical protein
MELVKAGLAGLILPAVVSALIVWVTRRGERWREAGAALALGVGFAAGQWIIKGYPGLPPIDATNWPFWIALAAAIWAVVESAARIPNGWRNVIRSVLPIFALLVICWPRIGWNGDEGGALWNRAQTLGWVGGFFAASLVWGWNSSGLARATPAAVGSTVLLVVITAMGIVFVEAHSADQGRFGLALAATLVPAVVVGWWRSDQVVLCGGLPVIWLLVPSLIAINLIYSDLKIPHAVLLGSAPLVAWFTRVKPLRRWSPRVQAVVALLLVFVPSGLALYLAYVPSDGY